MFATVVISPNQRGIGNGLTYSVRGASKNIIGCLVNVPFRKQIVEGVITGVSDDKPSGNFDVKDIIEVINEQQLLSLEQMEIAKWMAGYYMCDLRRALSVFLPGKKWSGLLCESDRAIRSGGFAAEVSLTPSQTLAYKAIKSDARPTLVFGVTCSGKTEIYAALICDAIRRGQSAILLLPEIFLTENFITRFQELVDTEEIAVMHSKLTPAKRREAWKRCRAGRVKLVIGSRSALFAPVQNRGVVIIDEEHEWTYKNEQSPRYHAIKVAEQLQKDSKLVLGSATPSVDSWHKAKTGEYHLVELPERYGGAKLPAVRIVDMAQVDFGKYYPMSPTLINAIRERMNRKEQVILFLNRRGFATSLMCMGCRYRFEDVRTQLPYTVHRRGAYSYLLSHHTGERMDIPGKCPKCGSVELREVGAGTQRIEDILTSLFPGAGILRADADTLESPKQMKILLDSMKRGRADILLGTQSVVKGLDLPNVTLAAVLLADIGLSLPHFRAGERVFQLLTQLAGRAGRAGPGEVIIQTFRPGAPEIKLAASHDVRAYLENELKHRRESHYPPDSQMVRLVFSGRDAMLRAGKIKALIERDLNVHAGKLHISCSPSMFAGGKIWHVFVRGKDADKTINKIPREGFTVDVDPIECV